MLHVEIEIAGLRCNTYTCTYAMSSHTCTLYMYKATLHVQGVCTCKCAVHIQLRCTSSCTYMYVYIMHAFLGHSYQV